MKKIVLSTLASLAIAGAAHAAVANSASTSFAPQNNRHISAFDRDANQGIDEATFTKVVDKIVSIYTPIAKAHGFGLQFNYLWTDDTVNSDTDTEGSNWVINSYGGLARYAGMTSDAYAAVACHELGHHLGGAPLFGDGSGMSVEGEADYHVGTKCLHKYFAGDDNVKIVSTMTIDPVVVQKCSAAYTAAADVALCERSSAAGFILAKILQDLGGESPVSFSTPDTSVVTQTNEDHPAAQCRLDTYFASALCTVSSDIELSDTSAKTGACTTGAGARPLCWYKP